MRHSLLRGGRWHRARSGSRALWTSATASEVADLLATPPLRRQLEQFLQFATEAMPEVERVLVFDEECRHLHVTVSATTPATYRWDWTTETISILSRARPRLRAVAEPAPGTRLAR